MGIIFAFLQTAPVTQQTTNVQQGGKLISGSFDTSKYKTDAQWKNILTPQQYNILRQAGTEVPFSGKLEYENRKGTYYSVGCDEPIFRSEQKYDSGTGWPSFWAPISKDALVLRKDDSIPGEPRIEVLDKCGGHLGHVFDDGPQPTGKRYCMNSIAMYFVPDKNQ
ncbi:MAG: peptide-methionine (R)-S-oxide reductase MsrB [Patescibacteria group bacterium]|nr:peptide-methionine (R)-S-oxide reductase MsrB [Patescibacteria group bacterium]MDE2590211.1 peptide-methionine (R)-S-oxide reductase MsrB [Patescibacteria group bacterium]